MLLLLLWFHLVSSNLTMTLCTFQGAASIASFRCFTYLENKPYHDYSVLFHDSVLKCFSAYDVLSKSSIPTGETYILFNKQMKGNKRELIQFGVPIFGHIQEEATCNSKAGNLHRVRINLSPLKKKRSSTFNLMNLLYSKVTHSRFQHFWNV